MNATDQMRSGAPGGADSVSPAAVGEVLARMAGHFATFRPDAFLTPTGLAACVAGEVYIVGGRTVDAEGSPLALAVNAALPAADFTLSRAGYAVLLVEAAVARGWSEGDNDRAIPTVPGPRTAPVERPAAPVPAPRPSTGEAGR
ncbi:hypothetical protein [Streptomyces variabilis]